MSTFGWYTKNDNVPFARIVQLGWVVAGVGRDAEAISKSSLIQPEGFLIMQKAQDIGLQSPWMSPELLGSVLL